MIEEKITPVGEITITDLESGEIVYTGHNMIVKEGRNIICNSLFASNEYKNFYPYFETIDSAEILTTDYPNIRYEDIYNKILITDIRDSAKADLEKTFKFLLGKNIVALHSKSPIITQIGLIATKDTINFDAKDDNNNYIYTNHSYFYKTKDTQININKEYYQLNKLNDDDFHESIEYYELKDNTYVKTTDTTKDSNKDYYYYEKNNNPSGDNLYEKFYIRIPNKNDNNIILFSRAPIDQFYLRNNRTYEVTYKIKF